MASRIWIALCAWLALAGLSHAQQTDDVFNRAAAALRHEMPEATVGLGPRGMIGLSLGPGQPGHAFPLDDLRAQCAAQPGECENAATRFAHDVAETVRSLSGGIRREQLIAVVRARSYIDTNAQISGADRHGGYVTAPLGTDMVSLCYVDLPLAMRPIWLDETGHIGASREAVYDVCSANTHARLPALETRWQDIPQGAFGTLRDAPNQAGYLLYPEDWRPLAQRLGSLAVAAPSDDLVIYGRGGAVDVDAMLTLATQMHARVSRPISPRVLCWTANGWVEATPGAACPAA